MDDNTEKPRASKPRKKAKKITPTPTPNKLSIENILEKVAANQVKVVPLSAGNLIAPSLNLDAASAAEVAHAMRTYAREEREENKIIKRDLSTLESIVTEYLKTFMIIGYDMKGEKITITHVNSMQEHDSIVEHARGTLISVLMKAQQNLPGFPG